MRYIWHGNLRIHHISDALTSHTKLLDHLRTDPNGGRKVSFTEYRAAGKGRVGGELPCEGGEGEFYPPGEGETVTAFMEEKGVLVERHLKGDKWVNDPCDVARISLTDVLSDTE